MIRLPAKGATTPAERYALELLTDLSRLVPVDDPTADIVHVELTDPPGKPPDVRTLSASRWLMQPGDGVVKVQRTAVHVVADVASANAEQRSEARDRHGRVPPAENELVKAGIERHPVLSEAAVRLREAVVAAAGHRPVQLVTPWPDGRRWAAAFTHDLDVVAKWPVFTALRLVELLSRFRLVAAAETVGAALLSAFGDPVGRGVEWLLAAEKQAGIRSSWFILCGTPTFATMRRGDLTYDPDSPAARRILDAVVAQGHTVGLHGSFATMEQGELFAEQRAHLASLANRAITGVRQHFLRLRPGATHHAMRAAGFDYDSTSGFADRNGFRLGVADVVPLWDVARRQPIGLDEVPFTWMDRALSKYRGIEDPLKWVKDAAHLADRCRAVDGLWVGVWHPNLVGALGFPGAPAALGDLIQRIKAMGPWIATTDEVVAWRRLRRRVRARTVAPDGRFEHAEPDTRQVVTEAGQR